MSKGYHDYFLSFSQSSLDKEGRSNSYFSPDSRLVHPLFSHSSYVDKLTMLHHILNNKIHGISFSPYLDGQSPGVAISAKQITDRLSILTPHTDWIRTFSCVDGNEQAPGIAKAQGLKTMVGVEIGSDKDKNDIEINNAIKLAKAGYADILVIGNEVLLRGDLKVEELLDYIHRVKAALPEQLVSYVDAYFLFENYPSIVQACDVLLVNCYPFWEETQAEYAIYHMQDMYKRTLNIANGKKVIISETGWPTIGTPFGQAVPSYENALSYFIGCYQWAQQQGVDIFYFSGFDELWKTGNEGDVGAYWGLWDSKGCFKYK